VPRRGGVIGPGRAVQHGLADDPEPDLPGRVQPSWWTGPLASCGSVSRRGGSELIIVRPYLHGPFARFSAVPMPFQWPMPPWRHNDRDGGRHVLADAYVGGLNK